MGDTDTMAGKIKAADTQAPMMPAIGQRVCIVPVGRLRDPLMRLINPEGQWVTWSVWFERKHAFGECTIREVV